VSRITAIIADDEPLARERIRTLLARFPEVEVVGESADGRETVSLVRSLRPDLLFLDVQMPELNGFEVLEKLHPKISPEVVFVTAYDEFALHAFEVHAIDYLLKPFTRARFARAMEHGLRRLKTAAGAGKDPRLASLLESIRAQQAKGDRLAIRDDGSVYFVRFLDIDWLEGAGNYVKVHAQAREHLLRDTLKNLATGRACNRAGPTASGYGASCARPARPPARPGGPILLCAPLHSYFTAGPRALRRDRCRRPCRDESPGFRSSWRSGGW